MTFTAEHNDGFKFLLICIDGFSKHAWAKPVRTKSGAEVVSAFQAIVNTGRKPDQLLSDRGKEFQNHHFQKFFADHGIQYYTCNNPDIKCSIVERFNRTRKTRIWKHLPKQ